MVRLRRGSARPHGGADGRVCQKVRYGDDRPHLRTGAARPAVQYGGDHRCRRELPGQIPQESHPPYFRLLGKVLLPSRQPRLPGVRDPLRQDRPLHLLRPPLPRRGPSPGPGRGGDRLQPFRHRGRAVPVPVAARAAGPCRGQRLLHGLHQPGRRRGAVETGPVLRQLLFRRSPGPDIHPGFRGPGRTAGGRV